MKECSVRTIYLYGSSFRSRKSTETHDCSLKTTGKDTAVVALLRVVFRATKFRVSQRAMSCRGEDKRRTKIIRRRRRRAVRIPAVGDAIRSVAIRNRGCAPDSFGTWGGVLILCNKKVPAECRVGD